MRPEPHPIPAYGTNYTVLILTAVLLILGGIVSAVGIQSSRNRHAVRTRQKSRSKKQPALPDSQAWPIEVGKSRDGESVGRPREPGSDSGKLIWMDSFPGDLAPGSAPLSSCPAPLGLHRPD
jgi:hypothetical protein